MKKRILSIMMVVMMVITMLPSTAFATWTNSEQTVDLTVGKKLLGDVLINGGGNSDTLSFSPDGEVERNEGAISLTSGTVPNGITLGYGAGQKEPQLSGTPTAGTVGTHVLTFTDSTDNSTLQVTITIAKGTQTIGVDDGDTISIPFGANYTLDTYSTDANGDKIDVSAVNADLVSDHQPTYTYASSNTSIVTVDETTGVITPVSVGTTTITINSAATESYEAATAKTISLTVTGHKVTSDLTNLTTTGSSGVGNSADYTATLTANTGYALPEIIIVTGASSHTYDSSTGDITITSSAITGDISITASGSLITYTVTFKADGTEVGKVNYTVENTTITEPTVPSKDYYAGAWESYSLTGGDVTVNAVYTANDYTVTFIADGVTVDTETYTVENTSITEPTVPSKDYYAGTWESYSLTGGDVTVNAVYTQTSLLPQTLTFTDNSVTKSVEDATFGNVLTGANTMVTYATSNEDVATVDTSSGLVTIVGAGTATITATAEADSTYQSATGSFALTVNEGEISLTTDQTVVFDANYADLKEVILTVNNEPITLTQTDNLLSGYTGYTFNNGILGEVNEGSVEVTLYKEFLATLPVGDYSVSITTNDGSGTGAITGTIPTKTTHTVTITNSGSGTSGTLTNQEYGTVIDLTAGTRSGYTFSSWTVTGDIALSDNQCIVLGDGTITANWTKNSSSSSSSSSTYYDITIGQSGSGAISPDGGSDSEYSIKKYNSQTFTFTPEDGYEIEDVLIDGISVGAVDSYTFSSVTSDHTIYVIFSVIGEHTNPQTGVDVFDDVTDSDWFYDSVMNAYENGWVSGTEDNTYSPYLTASRAMVVTILYRMENVEADLTTLTFSDVSADDWFAEGVAWASEHGIVSGYTEEIFAPNNPISREQLATILYRYAIYLGMDVSVGESTNILSYTDVFQVDDYAMEAMQWACGSGIIRGNTESTLNPDGNTTRAELAVILTRFAELEK